MGKRNFIIADIHGCYDGLLSSLEKAGYDTTRQTPIISFMFSEIVLDAPTTPQIIWGA